MPTERGSSVGRTCASERQRAGRGRATRRPRTRACALAGYAPAPSPAASATSRPSATATTRRRRRRPSRPDGTCGRAATAESPASFLQSGTQKRGAQVEARRQPRKETEAGRRAVACLCAVHAYCGTRHAKTRTVSRSDRRRDGVSGSPVRDSVPQSTSVHRPPFACGALRTYPHVCRVLSLRLSLESLPKTYPRDSPRVCALAFWARRRYS